VFFVLLYWFEQFIYSLVGLVPEAFSQANLFINYKFIKAFAW